MHTIFYWKLTCNNFCRELALPLLVLIIPSPDQMPRQPKFTAEIITAKQK
jgi:hypothetical protein